MHIIQLISRKYQSWTIRVKCHYFKINDIAVISNLDLFDVIHEPNIWWIKKTRYDYYGFKNPWLLFEKELTLPLLHRAQLVLLSMLLSNFEFRASSHQRRNHLLWNKFFSIYLERTSYSKYFDTTYTRKNSKVRILEIYWLESTIDISRYNS